MATPFTSADEFIEIADALMQMLADDDVLGRALAESETPQRFVISDLDVVLDAAGAEGDQAPFIVWTFDEDADWEPLVTMKLSSETFNRYFQGKVNPVIAAATGKIKTSGDFSRALKVAPLIKPAFGRYRDMLKDRAPHLLV